MMINHLNATIATKNLDKKEDLKKLVYSCKKVVPNMQEENNKVLEPGIRLREDGINLVNSEESILKTCDICLKVLLIKPT